MDQKSAKAAKRRRVWSEGDTQHLLELWAERATDLRRAKRNGHIYQEMSLEMHKAYSAEEVHVKIRNFTQKYREEKKEMGPSGGSPSSCQYYNAVHQIIGSNAANSAPVLESFIIENSSDGNCQPSPGSQPLSSPSSPLDRTCSPVASSSTAKKRNNFAEVVNMIDRQNEILQNVVEDTQTLSHRIVDAIEEQNANSQQFLALMKTLVDRI